MFAYGPHYDDIIAHFIGHWEFADEAARLRLELAAFRHRPEGPADAAELDLREVLAVQPHAVKYFIPAVEHTPMPYIYLGGARINAPAHTQRSEPDDTLDALGRYTPPPMAGWGHSGPMATPLAGPDPGQVIFVVKQQIFLEDNDVLDQGGAPLPEMDPTVMPRLEQMAEAVFSGNPLGQLEAPTSTAELGEYVVSAQQQVSAATFAPEGLVAGSEVIAGTYVNGEQAEDFLPLDDVLPEVFRDQVAPEAVEQAAQSAVLTEVPDGTLALQAGGNLLVNSALLTNGGMLGGVIGVAGDVHRLDVIVQSNAYSDRDTLVDVVGASTAAPTLAYNNASFSQSTFTAAARTGDGSNSQGPVNWQVTVVDGDLVFAQWLVQASFVYDNDIHVLTETGSQSNFVTGANMAQNITSFSDLGIYYDLIIVGGSLYDANLIVQGNVLLDDDIIYGNGYAGGLSTGGNLLYNGASIANVGAAQWNAGLPGHYRAALDRAEEDEVPRMPEGFRTDADFAGLPGISALIVTGNIFDLHYIRQFNVLGDADQVAIAEAAIAGNAAADWQITTGSNALVNIASIVDIDTMGANAYVGGDLYSDAVLIQAEILAGNNAGSGTPDALVNEAIAFLGNDDAGDLYTADHGIAATIPSDTSLDVMHSILT